MTKLKGLLSLSCGMLAVFALAGCLGNDENEPEGGSASFSFTYEGDVLNITAPQGSGAGSITTKSVDSYCDEGDLVQDTTADTSKYVISGGNLYIWSQGDCLATKLTGSSSTIIGTWTATSLAATDSVPAAFRPSVCDDDEFEEEDTELFENTSIEYTISSTKIKGTSSGRICFARALADQYEGPSSSVDVTAEDCTTLKLSNEDGKSATITTGFKNDSVTVKFTYGKKTCNGAIYFPLSNAAPICSEDEDEGSSMEAYTTCVVESGFYGEIILDKKAFAKKMSLALKPDASPF